MSYAKQDILSRLSKCHDQIKEHPFRTSFTSEYISDYKYLLYHLTEIWCDLIWRCDELTDMERARLRYFDGWIHDFRQYLRTWDKTSFPMWCFDYYEQMLQVTHTFIDTGEYPEYYNLDVYFIGNAREVISTKHIWVTEKLDGTSTSFGLRKEKKRKYDFAVCSRNVRQADINQKCFYEDNVYHEMANKYNIKSVLMTILERYNATTVVLQGETIGESIQKNKYGLTGRDFYAFNLVVDGKKIDSAEAINIVKEFGIKWVPILDENFILLPTVNEMIQFADGKSTLCDTLREGLVIRDHDNMTSFKCISNQFLLMHNL